MASYKATTRRVRLSEAVADAVNELACLRDEMSEWRDNMDGTGLENTSKYEAVSQAADDLDNFVGDLAAPTPFGDVELTYIEMASTRKGRAPSRATRLGNAVNALTAAAEALRDKHEEDVDASGLADELEELAENVEGVEFPGMYGG